MAEGFTGISAKLNDLCDDIAGVGVSADRLSERVSELAVAVEGLLTKAEDWKSYLPRIEEVLSGGDSGGALELLHDIKADIEKLDGTSD